MFRWCTLCQRLAGEIDPLEDYRIAPGLCVACARRPVEDEGLKPRALQAQRLFGRLMQSGAKPGAAAVDAFLKEAEASGIPPSELLVGVLQPALYEIGRQWERGEVTVVEEHRFTEFCLAICKRLELSVPPPGSASILLAMTPGNRHDVGLRILERLALERDIRCRILPECPAEAIAAAAAEEKPDLLGLSVSMAALLPAARHAVALSLRRVPGLTVAVGGKAVRNLPKDYFPGASVARRLDDFLDALSKLARLH